MKTIDCKKAKRLYDDLAEGRVAEPLAAQLQQHLDDCTDCRVLRQRSARLQQLLAIKRHEQPDAAYFDGFLNEFHRRLADEAARPTWRERLAAAISIEITPLWRYGLAGACGALLALGLAWRTPTPVSSPIAQRPPVNVVPVETDAVRPPQQLAVVPSAWQADAGGPQYVLERIAITPASYETASVRF